MRSIQNLESCRDDKKRALSCVALKKEKKDLKDYFLSSCARRRPARVRGED